MTIGKKTSKKLFVDESRMWNMEQPIDASIGSMLRGTTRLIFLGYFWKDAKAESLLNISGSSKDLSTISITKKNNYLRKLSLPVHKKRENIESLYSHFTDNWTVLRPIVDLAVDLYQSRVGRLFLPTFYYDRASTNFLKHLMYLREITPENSKNELHYPNIGRKYYSYKKTDFVSHKFQSTDIDWPFQDKYFKSIGLSIRGFQFLLLYLSNLLKIFSNHLQI